MKDILFEEHLKLIEMCSEMSNFDRELCSKLASELTRKHMKGFAEWAFVEGWEWEGDNSGWHSDNEPDEAFTTEQLMDKYFEELNKQP
jgi:hypothetical protein